MALKVQFFRQKTPPKGKGTLIIKSNLRKTAKKERKKTAVLQTDGGTAVLP